MMVVGGGRKALKEKPFKTRNLPVFRDEMAINLSYYYIASVELLKFTSKSCIMPAVTFKCWILIAILDD